MDDMNNQSGPYPPVETTGNSGTGTAARMKEKMSDKASDDFRRKAADKIEDSRKSAANALDSTASKLHSGVNQAASSLHSGTDQFASSVHAGTDQFASSLHSRTDQVSRLGHSAADGLQSAADYIRKAKLSSIRKDFEGVIKQYPAQSIAAAAIVGFLFARSFGKRD